MSVNARKITRKLVNSPDRCVDDNLRGLVDLYPRLRLHPRFRVVTLKHQDGSGKVAIIGGGGSGHEPFAAGMVGDGMLHGAVAGGVFASPPATHVLYAITQLYKHYSGGVLVIIGNYTGDRLNFGKSIEKAKTAGVKVEGIIVGEDVASSKNKTGGRGMCGEVFMYKMCGAMSREGIEFDALRMMAAEITENIATLGVCLSACSLPGQPPLFEILPGELELGAGVHGEAGIKKMKLGSAAEVVLTIVEELVKHLMLKENDRVAVLLNNLGGTTILEMNILSGETKKCLSDKGIKVERMYAGHLKSSLEMHGFQICLLNLNRKHGDYWLKLLDEATDAPGWPGTALSVNDDPGNVGEDEDVVKIIGSNTKRNLGPKLSTENAEKLRKCLKAATDCLITNEDVLNKLDSGCGDGDCGITLRNFALAVQNYIQKAALEYPFLVLYDMSELAEKDMGGTSGGIYSLGLSAASQAFADKKTADCTAWAHAWEQAIEAIIKYGGAEPGDRTMLDSMIPAVKTLKDNLKSDWNTMMVKITEAARRGAKATANMAAKAGRASYVAADYAKDEDAGAVAAALWIKAITEKLKY